MGVRGRHIKQRTRPELLEQSFFRGQGASCDGIERKRTGCAEFTRYVYNTLSCVLGVTSATRTYCVKNTAIHTTYPFFFHGRCRFARDCEITRMLWTLVSENQYCTNFNNDWILRYPQVVYSRDT